MATSGPPWDSQRIHELVKEEFGQRPLVLVSNREPYEHRQTPQGVRVDRPIGGLTGALDPVLQATGGTWVAWGSGSADRETADELGRVAVPPERPAYTLRRIFLTPQEVDGFYYGYANRALWPLCHLLIERAQFSRGAWRHYAAVNRRFAEAVLEEMQDASPAVWFQDYHLALCPALVREARPQALLAHFWHIPWPPPDIFRVCPQRRELLEGLLGNDLIGLQTEDYVRNFLACVEAELGLDADVEAGTVAIGRRMVSVCAFPISIDAAWFARAAAAPSTVRLVRRLRQHYGLEGVAVGLGVDRLDYTKGIRERLQALDLFFSKYPEYRGRFTFIQIAVPSRTRIEAYRRLRGEIEALIEEINARYGEAGWRPIHYLAQGVRQAVLVAYYQLADLVVVSSLMDGMNLVAKEYVTSRPDGQGVLLLSELAGVSRELHGSVPINPFDIEGLADALARALTMDSEERRERMRAMRAQVQARNIYEWMARTLLDLGKVARAPRG
ncbi:MAG: trehalose-6-phosphate synthase [Deltaproteobacteria bacterium]|nr:trehalose-6-phosphate synthase [Deltaproteobacteria bacterium]MBI3078599.1 trehalose-6-phosphate synthase [Deltaproteobacteria bacterium]